MQGVKLPAVDSVLCIGAHADDIEIGCGATLLELIAANPQLHVQWCVFSAAEIRASEARASAERFLAGVSERAIDVFAFDDSYFPNQWAQIKETMSGLAKHINPELIFSHRLDDRHQDHRVLAELTWCAFRDHLILEYEIPKYEGDLGQPNFYSPISTRSCDQKIAILLECFASQSNKPWFDEELFRSLMRLRGSECNSATRYAEAFGCRKTTIDCG